MARIVYAAVTSLLIPLTACGVFRSPGSAPAPPPQQAPYTPFGVPAERPNQPVLTAPLTPAAPARTVVPVPTPPAGDVRRSTYPLRAAEAFQYASAGYSVAGGLETGSEVRVVATMATRHESKRVQEQVCGMTYDDDEKRYVNKCRFETVDKRVPVQKRVYRVSGTGSSLDCETVAQAWSRVPQTDYWRRF